MKNFSIFWAICFLGSLIWPACTALYIPAPPCQPAAAPPPPAVEWPNLPQVIAPAPADTALPVTYTTSGVRPDQRPEQLYPGPGNWEFYSQKGGTPLRRASVDSVGKNFRPDIFRTGDTTDLNRFRVHGGDSVFFKNFYGDSLLIGLQSGGGVAIPSGRVPFGTGSGLTSDAQFLYDESGALQGQLYINQSSTITANGVGVDSSRVCAFFGRSVANGSASNWFLFSGGVSGNDGDKAKGYITNSGSNTAGDASLGAFAASGAGDPMIEIGIGNGSTGSRYQFGVDNSNNDVLNLQYAAAGSQMGTGDLFMVFDQSGNNTVINYVPGNTAALQVAASDATLSSPSGASSFFVENNSATMSSGGEASVTVENTGSGVVTVSVLDDAGQVAICPNGGSIIVGGGNDPTPFVMAESGNSGADAIYIVAPVDVSATYTVTLPAEGPANSGQVLFYNDVDDFRWTYPTRLQSLDGQKTIQLGDATAGFYMEIAGTPAPEGKILSADASGYFVFSDPPVGLCSTGIGCDGTMNNGGEWNLLDFNTGNQLLSVVDGEGGFIKSPSGNNYIEITSAAARLQALETGANINIVSDEGMSIESQTNNVTIQAATFVQTQTPLTQVEHLYGNGNNGGAPSIAVGADAGTGATASIVGAQSSDLAGRFSVTTGTGASSGLLATITFANSYEVPPVVHYGCEDEDCTTLGVLWVAVSTTTFELISTGAISPADSTTYEFSYIVICGARD